ncbi:MAG: hypothetical protein IKS52_09860 [Clostridia bacterium]|nr:hypothetical protein [Clostridia bacterium]MBO4884698.1 hypothetical protein [Clostridia bacterium]MBR4443557.1 hypothetical protein [Clostridia bacterium]
MTYVHFDAEDLKKNALPAALGCVCFPVPLIFCPKSRLGRFCANQGLILLLAYIAVQIAFSVLGVVAGWIPLIGWAIKLAGVLARAAIVLTGFYLAWQTYNKKPMRAPYVGDFDLIH